MKNKHRLLLLGITLLATIGIGWRMVSLMQEETLWGHLPLAFFLFAWASIVLIFWKRYASHPKGLRWLGLSTLSAVLLSLGFPPLPLTPILFLAWIPLLIVEHEVSKEREIAAKDGSKGPTILKYTYHTFVLWNVLVTWWVANTAFAAGIVAIWVNALLMCGPILLFSWTKRVTPNLGYGAFIVYWICFELLHLTWEVSWSWLNLGNAWAALPSFIQWYEYTGIFGGTLWILAVNILIFNLLRKSDFFFSFKKLWQENIGGVINILGLVFIPIVVSLFMYFNHEEKGREVEVTVVQPNFEPHYEKFRINRREQLERFVRLSREGVTAETDYLVFPETSFRAGEKERLAQSGNIGVLRRFLQNYPNLKLVSGVSAYHVFGENEPHSNATREDIRNGETIHWEAYNAAIQLQAGQDSIPFYIKSKLVPGAETMPYPKLFAFLKPLVDKLDGAMEGHGKQEEREAFESESGKIAPVICYESVFGDYHAGYIAAGAEAIFIVTNDGWWDNSGGHKQHLAYASLRAIETRRSIARSANTGVSCFLNQRGDILQPTEYGVEATVNGKIRMNSERTFYTIWRDIIARVALFIAGIIFLNTISKGLHRKKE